MGDVLIFNTLDGGEIRSDNTGIETVGGFDSAVYLSLFSWSEWWFDSEETDPAKVLTGETGQLIQSLPVNGANLRRIEEAARRDLQHFLDEGISTAIAVVVSLENRNNIRISVAIVNGETRQEFEFLRNWEALASGN